MDITYDTDPKDMDSKQLSACLRVLNTARNTIEAELLRRLMDGQAVEGYQLGLRKVYK